jgi:tellurite resistance protein
MPANDPPSMRMKDEPNMEAIVELMFLAAFADGEFSDDERRHFMRSVESLTDRQLHPGTLDEIVRRAVAELQVEGRAARIASVRARLPSAAGRKVALSLAIQVVVADGIIRTSERELLNEIADALEIDRDEAADLVVKLSS